VTRRSRESVLNAVLGIAIDGFRNVANPHALSSLADVLGGENHIPMATGKTFAPISQPGECLTTRNRRAALPTRTG
jgi:hypothetical protein